MYHFCVLLDSISSSCFRKGFYAAEQEMGVISFLDENVELTLPEQRDGRSVLLGNYPEQRIFGNVVTLRAFECVVLK